MDRKTLNQVAGLIAQTRKIQDQLDTIQRGLIKLIGVIERDIEREEDEA
jgi:hypothetical protein